MMTSRQLVAAKQALEALQSYDAQPVGANLSRALARPIT